MKKLKNENGTVTVYNLPNPELHRQLRAKGHRVMEDRKKRGKKYACRRKQRSF